MFVPIFREKNGAQMKMSVYKTASLNYWPFQWSIILFSLQSIINSTRQSPLNISIEFQRSEETRMIFNLIGNEVH